MNGMHVTLLSVYELKFCSGIEASGYILVVYKKEPILYDKESLLVKSLLF